MKKFDRIVLLDQTQEQYSHSDIFVSMFRLLNFLEKNRVVVEILNPTNFNTIRYWEDLITNNIHDTIMEKDATASPQIFYSMENNTIGEAALLRVMDMGEENIEGMFLSEPIRKGHRRKFRRGFNTTAKHKIDACTKFKELVENNKMQINSKLLITELKDFVAQGMSFKAKPGQHDDLVSACLLMTRMIKVLADFDPKIFEKWTDRTSEWTAPMPIFANLYG
jgi:hypothetical protein